MAEGYRFHEVRKNEREAVLAFVAEHGSAVRLDSLRHHLSLTVEAEGELVAAALCLEPQPNQFVIEIVVGDAAVDEALLKELADRCLRKVQAQDIAAARLRSPAGESAERIWTSANWLDQIEESPPPEHDEAGEEPAQAA